MSNIRYLIRLKPADAFFFGGRVTFEGGDSSEYSVTSEKFPQQSSLLGMLRKLILDETGLLSSADKKQDNRTTDEQRDLIKAIGDASFHPDKSGQSFGYIHQLSPVFLMNGNLKYFVQPNDFSFGDISSESSVSFSFGGKSYKPGFLFYSDYKPKEGIPFKTIPDFQEDGKGIFIEQPQVGITVKDIEGAFYRQQFWRLNKAFEFAFYAILSSEFKVPSKPVPIKLGGENSIFSLKFETVDNPKTTITEEMGVPDEFNKTKPPGFKRYVLLSDTWFSETVNNLVFHSVSQTRSFSNIETSLEKTSRFDRFNKTNKISDGFGKSQTRQVYTRGSVFWLKDSDTEIFEEILNMNDFAKIGFNSYIKF